MTFILIETANQVRVIVGDVVWVWQCIESINFLWKGFESHASGSRGGPNPHTIVLEPMTNAVTVEADVGTLNEIGNGRKSSWYTNHSSC